MTIREQLEAVVKESLQVCVAAGALELEEVPEPTLERPREEAHGDWACTDALRLAKVAKKNPREIAQALVDNLPENNLVASCEIAGPGFINFTLQPAAFQQVVAEARQQGSAFGRSELPEACNVNLEYVSANPTGPMHVGHGRWAALGDSIARVMRHAGYKVHEEFYVNDAGNQMNVFANSIVVRYLQELGQNVELPEEAYGGGYITELAKRVVEEDGDKWLEANEQERLAYFREKGYAWMLQSMKDTLTGFNTNFSTWFSERDLYLEGEDGKTAIQRAQEMLDEKGLLYENEGALFFKSTEFGDDKDRVLVKSDGALTYFMSDIAYHYNKMGRGFDHLIDLWGADHHGYIKRCEAMMAAGGYEGKFEVVLGQLVNLFRDGEAVRMSKRTGEMVTFDELIEEVGPDSTRYMMLSKSSDQSIDFDIEVAKKRDNSNPVYYVQYAHARICSILRKAAEVESDDTDAVVAGLNLDGVALSPLTTESELALMRKIADFTDLVAGAARDRAPFRLTHYAQELASLFHSFYNENRVIVEDEALMNARLALCDTTRIVLALTLSLLGVSAPSRM